MGTSSRCSAVCDGGLTTALPPQAVSLRHRHYFTERETCFEPDAHTHRAGDCWLKFTEAPEAVQVNQRGNNDAPETARGGGSYRARHPDSPPAAHWTSGVLLPPGWTPSNGTYGPRRGRSREKGGG